MSFKVSTENNMLTMGIYSNKEEEEGGGQRMY